LNAPTKARPRASQRARSDLQDDIAGEQRAHDLDLEIGLAVAVRVTL
jgi:hypothetical protein